MKVRYLLCSFICIFCAANALAHVKLLEPLGGEKYEIGKPMTIKWMVEVEHTLVDWDIYITYNAGATWEVLKEGLTEEVLEYEFVVPDRPSGLVQIRIVQDNVDVDYDDISGLIEFTDDVDGMMNGMVTGIDDGLFNSEELRAYPNPFSHELTIELPSTLIQQAMDVEIYTQSGKHITALNLNDQLLLQHDRLIWRPQNNLENGLYLIRLSDGKNYHFIKAIIEE